MSWHRRVARSEVFEAFSHKFMVHCKLYLGHFHKAPGLKWKATLKITGAKLGLLIEIVLLLKFGKFIQQDTFQEEKRCCQGNNEYMKDFYDLAELNRFLIYLDVHNFYGLEMV